MCNSVHTEGVMSDGCALHHLLMNDKLHTRHRPKLKERLSFLQFFSVTVYRCAHTHLKHIRLKTNISREGKMLRNKERKYSHVLVHVHKGNGDDAGISTDAYV